MFTRRKLGITSFAARRCAALLGAAALITGTLAAASAGPAAAASQSTPGYSKTTLTLSNERQYGTYAAGGVVEDSAIYIDESPAQWEWNDLGSAWAGGNPKISGENVEFHAITQKGTPTNWCLADTNGTVVAYLSACGSDGTIWVQVKNGNGDYLYNRYLTGMGEDQVLAVHDPAAGQAVTIASEPALRAGDGWYARWTFLGS